MDDKEKIKPKKKNKKQEYKLDAMPASELKMKYFKNKRRQKRIKTKIFQAHFFLKVLAIFLLLWLCSRLMISKSWFLPQTAFSDYPNSNLRIIGNNITPEDKILAALKAHPIPELPIYLINTSPYEKEIEKLSPVKKAFVRRYWLPARFEVTVEEEIPVLTISPAPNAPEIAAITKNGKIISKEYLPVSNENYKTYKILTYDNYKEWTKDEILHIKVLAQRIEDFSGEKLIYLDIRNKKDVFAQIEGLKIRIGELNSTLKERIERLTSVMPQIANLKRQTEYLDLRWDNTTYLKKRSKNSILNDTYYTQQQTQSPAQNTTENTKNAQQNKSSDNKKAENNITKSAPKHTTVINTQASPAAKQPSMPKAKPLPKQTKPTKKSEPQALPDIKIEIVEP